MDSSTPAKSSDTQDLLTKVRDKLAGHFASQLGANVRPIADMLQSQADEAKATERKSLLQSASTAIATMAEPLKNGLTAAICRQFDQKLSRERFNAGGTINLDSMQLVDDAEMQEEIALGKAVTRLKEQVSFEFFSLSRRIGHVLGIENMPDRDNPVYPGVFVHAVSDALRHCGMPAEQRVVIFEASGPLLLEILPSTYQVANDFLVGQGVLIEIQESYGRAVLRPSAAPDAHAGATGVAPPYAPYAPHAARGTTDAAGGGSGSPPAAPPADSVLVSLLQQVLGRGDARAGNVAAGDGRAAGGAQDPTYHALGAALSRTGAARSTGALGLLAGGLREHVSATLKEQASLTVDAVTPDTASPHGAPFAAPDRAFIEGLDLPQLVAAGVVLGAFNRLLASPILRRHAGGFLSQMQLPVLKAAFADPAILTDSEHPVRKAIDRLVEFAIAQPALLEPGTTSYESLSGLLAGILHGEAYDAVAFGQVAERIDTLFAFHEESAAENDPKAKMLVEIEIWESAINFTNRAIEARVVADDPRFVATFARVIWKEVLIGDMLNGGQNGERWKRDIESLELLLQSVRAQPTAEAREALVQRLPALQDALEERARSVNTDPAYLVDFMKDLRERLARVPAAPLKAVTADASADPLLATTMWLPRSQDGGPTSVMPHLVRGRWVEFIDDNGRRSRARLNWISPVGGVCLFKDYLDNATFTIALADLNRQLDDGRARIVESLGISRHAIEYAIRHLGLADA